MEEFLSSYGKVFISHNRKEIVLKSNSRNMTEENAELAMQEYLDYNYSKEEFDGKKVVDTYQYSNSNYLGKII